MGPEVDAWSLVRRRIFHIAVLGPGRRQSEARWARPALQGHLPLLAANCTSGGGGAGGVIAENYRGRRTGGAVIKRPPFWAAVSGSFRGRIAIDQNPNLRHYLRTRIAPAFGPGAKDAA